MRTAVMILGTFWAMLLGAQAQSTRTVVTPTPWESSAPPGVPSGFSILGTTATSPPGFTFTGSLYLAQQWAAKEPMLTARYGLAAAAPGNGKIYVLGGWNGVTLSTNEEYDPAAPAGNGWSVKANMPTARYGLAAAAGNGMVYVFGGQNPPGYDLATVDVYNPAANQWNNPSTPAPMPAPRAGHAAATASNGKIYVFGGLSFQNNAWEYDPATNTWTVKSNMPTGRHRLAAAAASNGKIYVFGGEGGLIKNEEYNPATDTWTAKANMPTGRQMLAAVAINDKIYVLGGEGGLTTNEEYDPATDSWKSSVPMPTGRKLLAAATVGLRCYAFGGYTGSNPFATNEEFSPTPYYLLYYVHTKD
ncbi:MAG: kelch repeat-containing protein [Planctomycetota bacterium]